MCLSVILLVVIPNWLWWKTNLKMATGGTTGTYYAFSGTISQVLAEKVDNLSFDVQSTGASKANIYLISDKEADIAIVQNDVMYYAYNGTDLFAGEKVSGFLQWQVAMQKCAR